MMNNNFETMEEKIIKQQEARIKIYKAKIEFYQEQWKQANKIIEKLSKTEVKI